MHSMMLTVVISFGFNDKRTLRQNCLCPNDETIVREWEWEGMGKA